MFNLAKHSNSYNALFRYLNYHNVKSFRKQSYFFFLKLLAHSYKMYLNNISISISLQRSHLCYQIFLHTMFQSSYKINSTFNVKYSLLSELYTMYCYCDSFIYNNGDNVFYFVPQVYRNHFFYLLLNVAVLNFMFYSFTLFSLSNIVSLPIRRKLFTLLRSPHTDKKSREQFTLSHMSKLFSDNLGLGNMMLRTLSTFDFYSFQVKNVVFNYYY